MQWAPHPSQQAPQQQPPPGVARLVQQPLRPGGLPPPNAPAYVLPGGGTPGVLMGAPMGQAMPPPGSAVGSVGGDHMAARVAYAMPSAAPPPPPIVSSPSAQSPTASPSGRLGSHRVSDEVGVRAEAYSRVGQAPPGAGTVSAYEPPCATGTPQGVFQVKNTFIELVEEPQDGPQATVMSVPGVKAALRSAPARYAQGALVGGPLVTLPPEEEEEAQKGAEQLEAPAAAPQAANGTLPSLGSAAHDGTGQCRPCAWFWKPQGCVHAAGCGYCHLCPEGELKARRRVKIAVLKSAQAPGEEGENIDGEPPLEQQVEGGD